MNGYVGISEPDKQYNVELFFFPFLYICIIHIFFHLKESTTVTTDKQRTKRIQQKKEIYRNVEDNSLPIMSDYVLPIRQRIFFSFFPSFTEEQESLLFVFMDVQIFTK